MDSYVVQAAYRDMIYAMMPFLFGSGENVPLYMQETSTPAVLEGRTLLPGNDEALWIDCTYAGLWAYDAPKHLHIVANTALQEYITAHLRRIGDMTFLPYQRPVSSSLENAMFRLTWELDNGRGMTFKGLRFDRVQERGENAFYLLCRYVGTAGCVYGIKTFITMIDGYWAATELVASLIRPLVLDNSVTAFTDSDIRRVANDVS